MVNSISCIWTVRWPYTQWANVTSVRWLCGAPNLLEGRFTMRLLSITGVALALIFQVLIDAQCPGGRFNCGTAGMPACN